MSTHETISVSRDPWLPRWIPVLPLAMAMAAAAALFAGPHALGQTGGGRPGGGGRFDGHPPPGGGTPYTPGDTLPDHPVWILAPTGDEILQGAPGVLGPMEMPPGGPFTIPPWQRGRRPRVSRSNHGIPTSDRDARGAPQGPFDDWQVWWELHRRSLLNLGWNRLGPITDRATRFFLGVGPTARRAAPSGPSRALVHGLIVPALLHAMDSTTGRAHGAAMLALAAAGHAGGESNPVIRDALGRDLAASSWRSRRAAVLGLGILATPGALADLAHLAADDGEARRMLDTIKPTPDRLRAIAAMAAGLGGKAGLGDLAAASLSPILGSLLRGDSASALLDPSIGAAIGLGMLEDPRSAADLLERVEDPREHPFVRAYAFLDLGWIGDQEAIPTALSWLDPRGTQVYPSMREAAVTALGLLGRPDGEGEGDHPAVQALAGVLRGSSVPALRHAAAMALGHIGGPAARAILRREVRRGGRRDRLAWAALALGADAWMHDDPNPAAAALLRERLAREHDPLSRAAVAIALGLLRDEEAAGPLLAILREAGNPALRAHASLALGLCGGGPGRDWLLAITRDTTTEPWIRREAATALGRIDPRGGVAEILDALEESTRAGERVALLRALGRVAGEEAVEPIVATLTAGSATAGEKAAAADALDRICSRGEEAWFVRIPADLPVAMPIETVRAVVEMLP